MLVYVPRLLFISDASYILAEFFFHVLMVQSARIMDRFIILYWNGWCKSKNEKLFTKNRRIVGNFFDETLSLGLTDVEVQAGSTLR